MRGEFVEAEVVLVGEVLALGCGDLAGMGGVGPVADE